MYNSAIPVVSLGSQHTRVEKAKEIYHLFACSRRKNNYNQYYEYRITITGVYAINKDMLVNIKRELYLEITKIGSARELRMRGNLNIRIGKKKMTKIIGRHGEDIFNSNLEILIDLCNQNQLRNTECKVDNRLLHYETVDKIKGVRWKDV